MKIILAAMAAVIVILVVALGAALMDKVDILIQEEPTRAAPNPKPAFTGDENRPPPRNLMLLLKRPFLRR